MDLREWFSGNCIFRNCISCLGISGMNDYDDDDHDDEWMDGWMNGWMNEMIILK